MSTIGWNGMVLLSGTVLLDGMEQYYRMEWNGTLGSNGMVLLDGTVLMDRYCWMEWSHLLFIFMYFIVWCSLFWCPTEIQWLCWTISSNLRPFIPILLFIYSNRNWCCSWNFNASNNSFFLAFGRLISSYGICSTNTYILALQRDIF